jgi:hypothetical protein
MKAFAVFERELSFIRITDRDALKQRIENGLRLQKGEWFLDPSLGVDWHGLRNSETVADRLLRYEIEKSVRRHDEVIDILTFKIETDRATRTTTVSLEILTRLGIVGVTL